MDIIGSVAFICLLFGAMIMLHRADRKMIRNHREAEKAAEETPDFGDLEYSPVPDVPEDALPSKRVICKTFDYDRSFDNEGTDVTSKMSDLGVATFEGWRYVFFPLIRRAYGAENFNNVLLLTPNDTISLGNREQLTPTLTPDIEFKRAAEKLAAARIRGARVEEERRKKAEEQRLLEEALQKFAESPMQVIGDKQKWVND